MARWIELASRRASLRVWATKPRAPRTITFRCSGALLPERSGCVRLAMLSLSVAHPGRCRRGGVVPHMDCGTSVPLSHPPAAGRPGPVAQACSPRPSSMAMRPRRAGACLLPRPCYRAYPLIIRSASSRYASITYGIPDTFAASSVKAIMSSRPIVDTL